MTHPRLSIRCVCFFGLLLHSMTAISGNNSTNTNWDVDGLNGALEVNGSLIESPCRLAEESLDQEIFIGDLRSSDLKEVGSESLPVKFNVFLRDCFLGNDSFSDAFRLGKLTFMPGESIFSLRFDGVRNETDYSLFKMVGGAEGIGLSLQDDRGNKIIPGFNHNPHISPNGYVVIPLTARVVRTPENLKLGNFYSSVYILMEYK